MGMTADNNIYLRYLAAELHPLIYQSLCRAGMGQANDHIYLFLLFQLIHRFPGCFYRINKFNSRHRRIGNSILADNPENPDFVTLAVYNDVILNPIFSIAFCSRFRSSLAISPCSLTGNRRLAATIRGNRSPLALAATRQLARPSGRKSNS